MNDVRPWHTEVATVLLIEAALFATALWGALNFTIWLAVIVWRVVTAPLAAMCRAVAADVRGPQ